MEREILSSYIGQNDVILFNIFKFLPVEDLKNVRFVCRKWKLICNPLIKKRVHVLFVTVGSRFLESFGVGMNRNTMSFIACFKGYKPEDLPFNSYFFKGDSWEPSDPFNTTFMNIYGKTIKHINVLSSNFEFLATPCMDAFRNSQNIESLSMKIVMSSSNFEMQNIGTRINEENSIPVQLNSLTSLKVYFGTDNFAEISVIQSQIVTQVMRDLILQSPNLCQITMNGCRGNTDAFPSLPRGTLNSITEITLDDMQCFQLDICHIFRILATLNLKLSSFSLQLLLQNCHLDSLHNVFSSLLLFLNSQKTTLRRLKIDLPDYFPDSQIALADGVEGIVDMNFPVMRELKRLELFYSSETFLRLFSNKNDRSGWTNLFPNLQQLQIHYTSYQFVLETVIPQMLQELNGACNFVNDVKLILKSHCVLENDPFKILRFSVKDFMNLHSYIKGKFRNLKRSNFKYVDSGREYLSTNGNLEDVVTHSEKLYYLVTEYIEGEDYFWKFSSDEEDDDPIRRFQELDFYEYECEIENY